MFKILGKNHLVIALIGVGYAFVAVGFALFGNNAPVLSLANLGVAAVTIACILGALDAGKMRIASLAIGIMVIAWLSSQLAVNMGLQFSMWIPTGITMAVVLITAAELLRHAHGFLKPRMFRAK